MQLRRCEKGHFYDGDKFAVCPHCQSDSKIILPEEAVEEDMPTVSLASYDDDMETVSISDSMNDDSETISIAPEDDKTVPVFEGEKGPNDVTMPVAAEAEEDEKTHGFYASYTPEGNNNKKIVPCVGWLVCINGKNRGQDFRLTEGRNYIGRLRSNTICLEDENTVAREKHAQIIFDPVNNRFLAAQGESKELYYVNGNLVLNQLELKQGDHIEIGKAVLLFVPLCDENFTWKEEE